MSSVPFGSGQTVRRTWMGRGDEMVRSERTVVRGVRLMVGTIGRYFGPGKGRALTASTGRAVAPPPSPCTSHQSPAGSGTWRDSPGVAECGRWSSAQDSARSGEGSDWCRRRHRGEQSHGALGVPFGRCLISVGYQSPRRESTCRDLVGGTLPGRSRLTPSVRSPHHPCCFVRAQGVNRSRGFCLERVICPPATCP